MSHGKYVSLSHSRETRHKDPESLAVGAPERGSEILVIILVEIGPSGLAILEIHYTDAYLGIGIPALRIACHPDRTSRRRHILKIYGATGILAITKLETRAVSIDSHRGINREERNLGVVETVETDLLRVRRPPESLIPGVTSEDLLIINPRRITIEDNIRSVRCQTGLFLCGDIHHPKIVIPGEGQLGRIRRIRQVLGSFHLERKGSPAWHTDLDSGWNRDSLCPFARRGIDNEFVIRVRTHARVDSQLMLADPYARGKHVVFLGARECGDANGKG